jgi:hypothetical protein
MAARAVNTATADFQKTAEKRPYNAAVLPADSGQFYVYLVPAQTTNGIYPLGGDARYLVSPDGTKIVEKRQLHSTILEVRSTQPGAKTEGGFHTHILTDVPEDTDVFFVLTRNPPLPEFIGTKRGNYLINRDGLIARIK